MVTRTTVVQCHPVAESFTAAVTSAVIDAATSASTVPLLIDLYAEGFDPSQPDHVMVDEHRRRLNDTDTLILVYPTWWSAQPALLQGWVDSVWARDRTIRQQFRSIRRIVVCTTHGSPKWLNALEGESGKRTVTRYLRSRCARRCRVHWLALYGMDGMSEDDRRRHLSRIANRIQRFTAR